MTMPKISIQAPKSIVNQIQKAPFGEVMPAPKSPKPKPVAPMTKALTPREVDRLDTDALLAQLIGDAKFRGNLDLKQLAGATPQHLARRFDLTLNNANRLAMLFEFAKRVARSHSDREKITSPADIASYLMSELR